MSQPNTRLFTEEEIKEMFTVKVGDTSNAMFPFKKAAPMRVATYDKITDPDTWLLIPEEIAKVLIEKGELKDAGILCEPTIEDPPPPDEEEVLALCEEITKLGGRILKMTNAILKARSNSRSAINCDLEYLKVALAGVRAYINESHGPRG